MTFGNHSRKAQGCFLYFPKIDTEKFNIHNDEQFALDFLHEKQVLVVPGKGFNWIARPLPRSISAECASLGQGYGQAEGFLCPPYKQR